MQWDALLFCHWPVDPAALRPLLPGPFSVDTWQGQAWIGLVPFTMPLFRSARLPRIPPVHRFHECNVRTYVTMNDRPGVWFFSLDAASRLAVWVARRFFHLNYRHARIELHREQDTIRYALQRSGEPQARMRCAWRVGAARPRSQPGDLEHFLTERYALFTVDGSGRPRMGAIHHEPWALREAELLELDDGLVAAAGVTVPAEPGHVVAADPVRVDSWWLETP